MMPETIKICGIEYTIKYFKDKQLVDGDMKENLVGQLEPDEKQIRIFSGVNETSQRHVLWHEIIHAIIDELHMKEMDEADIDRLAIALNMMVKL